MPDLADRATELIEWRMAQQEQRLAAAGSSVSSHGVNPAEVIECEECGDELPLARRRAIPGCRLCTECQELEERYNKRWF